MFSLGQAGPGRAQTSAAAAGAGSPARFPVVVLDKKGPVSGLGTADFALTVGDKPQAISRVQPASRLPVTYGLLIDAGRDAQDLLAEETGAAGKFLQTALRPAAAEAQGAPRAADRAFVLQFAHGAELLQDVTASPTLLAAGLKEVGTQAPGAEQDAEAEPTGGSNTGQGNGQGSGQGRQSGYPGTGRTGGYPGRGGSGSGGGQRGGDRARGGVVLYDALYLGSEEILQRQTGRRVLIVMTGGVDRHSKESLNEALEAAQRSGVTVYAVYARPRDSRSMRDGTYDPFGMPRMPGSGGQPGSDGTYADPDGRKILEKVCDATGGRVFERKGKDSLPEIFEEIAREVNGGYEVEFTPSSGAAVSGMQHVDLSLTRPELRHDEVVTVNGIYLAPADAH